jgi:hypothetical protein
MFRSNRILSGAVAGVLVMGAAGASFAQYTFNTGLTSSDAEARSIQSTISGNFGAVREAEKAAKYGEQQPVDRYAESVARAIAPANGYVNASVTVGDIPSTWSGSEADWFNHVSGCKARYRSYNAYTDKYVVRPGRLATCMLPMDPPRD